MSQDFEYFDRAYEEVPPWEINRPQKEIVSLTSQKELKGKILDIGCGTGENSLYLASLGFEVVGVDFSQKAIEKARVKAIEWHSTGKLNFIVTNALDLSEELVREAPFDAVVDSALYHSFEGQDTQRYIENVLKILKKSGTFFVLCFSDCQSGDWGPRRITRKELQENFSSGGWKIRYIKEAHYELNNPKLAPPIGGKAWLGSFEKV